ncbi:hypothetical protein LPJ53_003589 [Coemansia erecta]|uniref:PIG-U-domain-containing protein n=1 Tax=Coemansia erecta TaxID=147472 RepID=A0A9W7XYZ6_9FUNG|nr:hypothetical protein LPJ53_003589 [Coemansia erecta]
MSADTVETVDHDGDKRNPKKLSKQELANALAETLSRRSSSKHDTPDEPPASVARISEGSRLLRILLLGFALRLAVLTFASDFVARNLSMRVELSTPVTSYKRLVEGLYLASHGISPFDGGLFHQSPILLALFKVPYAWLPQLFSDAMYAGTDVATAMVLALIAAKKATLPAFAARPLVPGESRFRCLPSTVALLYLFNPLTLATCLARSSIMFSHLATVSALYFGIGGHIGYASVFAAVATHLSLYPVMLIAPISLMAAERNTPSAAAGQNQTTSRATGIALTLAKFAAAFASLHLLFAAVYGSEYFTATLDFTLRVSDLQPNVGLFWYFFIEIFDEFRPFFIAVFQLTALAFTVPISWRFRKDPLFGSVMLIGVISALKSYPAWGDLSLFLGLIPLYEELIKYMQYTFLSANLILFGVGLAPVFWYLWIEQGSGNANFFYAATLVYVFGQISLLFDLGSAMLRRELDIDYPEARERTVIQE